MAPAHLLKHGKEAGQRMAMRSADRGHLGGVLSHATDLGKPKGCHLLKYGPEARLRDSMSLIGVSRAIERAEKL